MRFVIGLIEDLVEAAALVAFVVAIHLWAPVLFAMARAGQ